MDDVKIPQIAKIRRALLKWHDEQGMHAPWRESAEPYECLVAAVMAQQTQMSRVLPSYERFMSAFPSVEALAAASLGDVIRVWVGMGYNRRAVMLHRAARAIAAEGWPRDAASLARIDGIGPFTAAIIASFAFGEQAACVDTNVRRVLGRIAGDETVNGARLQRLADAALAVEAPARWNQALMDYGARVCLSRPKCGECVVSRWCVSFAEQRFESREQRIGRPLGEERVAYAARRRRAKAETVFAGSSRFYRGRIVDALRATAPGKSLIIAALPVMIANGGAAPSDEETLVLVRALERDGLAVVRGGRVRLPG